MRRLHAGTWNRVCPAFRTNAGEELRYDLTAVGGHLGGRISVTHVASPSSPSKLSYCRRIVTAMSAQASSSGHQYVRPIPAYRPRRTRTRTGCLCCRLRRKKCDERKPVCRGCEARDLACSWPEEERPSCLRRANFLQSERGDGGKRMQLHRGVCIPVGSANSSAPLTPNAHLPEREEEHPSPPCSPLTARAPPEEVLQSPCASILLEHFVAKTSHILVGRDALRNPWLYSILPMAYSNPLVMHAVLAISGVHMMHCKPHGDLEQATYAHYGYAITQLKGRLATWRGGSQQETLHLFLAAVLLITYEVRSWASRCSAPPNAYLEVDPDANSVPDCRW
jgi:hypothetical protein